MVSTCAVFLELVQTMVMVVPVREGIQTTADGLLHQTEAGHNVSAGRRQWPDMVQQMIEPLLLAKRNLRPQILVWGQVAAAT